MLQTIVARSLDELQLEVIVNVLKSGGSASPRGIPTKELVFVGLTLLDPRQRCLTLNGRHWSLPLAIGEFCWHASGSNSREFLSWYAQKWADLGTGPTIDGSCYGRRVFGAKPGTSNQWTAAREILRADSNTRRAILFFHDAKEEQLSLTAPDVPCADSMQFIVRGGKLEALTYMRSNDVLLGMPYDIFLFTLLQEMMAAELELELGSYHHVVGSLHIYDRDRKVCESLAPSSYSQPMPAITSPSQLSRFLALEEAIRVGRPMPDNLDLNEYWLDLLKVLAWHAGRRMGINEPFTLGLPNAPLYRSLLAVAPTKPLSSCSR
jgi:thymidylate synthase